MISRSEQCSVSGTSAPEVRNSYRKKIISIENRPRNKAEQSFLVLSDEIGRMTNRKRKKELGK